jgi:4-amino-4-deoxy-L-arabinose transferase-like glycosyltransferase
MSDLPGTPGSRRSFFIGIVLLTLIGFGIRLYRLSNQSFWMDEVSSVTAAQGPLNGIYKRSALSANSLPTYFLMLKPLVAISGANIEFRARLLSVIAGTLSVPVFIGLVFLWQRRYRTALLAGTLLAVNPLHLWYSQETRGYSVMLFFGLLSLLCFEFAREKKRALWWALYAGSAIMAIAVHRTGILFPAGCGLRHVWSVATRRDNWKSLLGHVPVIIATLAALAVKSYPPPESYSRSASGLEIGYTFLTFVGGYSFGPSVTDIQSHGPLAAISNHAVQTGILGVILLTAALAFALNFRQLIFGREIQLVILGVGVVSIYALLSGFPYNVRYALPALFGFLALIAALTNAEAKSRLAHLTAGGLIVISLWADGQWFYRSDYRKDDSRAVAKWLLQNKQRIHVWTMLPSYMNMPIEWYLQNDPDILANERPPTSDRSTTFPPLPDVLIITRRHHLQDPNGLIAAYANTAHGAETNRTFAGFELYVGEKKNSVVSGK